MGRSGRKAYASFTFRRDKTLSDIAQQRLSAIREFTAFGSGFRIAMRDLQIRGAGRLLGHSQHGHMAVSYTHLRVEYWDDEIDSLASFDLLTQRRDGSLAKIYLSPAREVLFGNTVQTVSYTHLSTN